MSDSGACTADVVKGIVEKTVEWPAHFECHGVLYVHTGRRTSTSRACNCSINILKVISCNAKCLLDSAMITALSAERG